MSMPKRVLPLCRLAAAIALLPSAARGEDAPPGAPADGRVLEAVPPGWSLQACDDCGVLERQPRFDMTDSYVWTFQTSDTEADLKSRSAIFSYKAVRAAYRDLDPAREYVLAVTYASDHVYKRVQSLWADGVELHGPHPLPAARAVRLVVRVPRAVTADGAMTLEWRIHGEVNATVSIVELWSDGPPPREALRILGVSGLVGDLSGRVLDLAWDPVADAEVDLLGEGEPRPLATVRCGPDGRFRFARGAFEGAPRPRVLRISARRDGLSATVWVPEDRLSFEPVRYRPLPAEASGGPEQRLSLDGTWRLLVGDRATASSVPLDAPAWKDFRVPGQWRQQGFKIPADRPVTVAREVSIPREWWGRRIFLRFDAIHAGTTCWWNGQRIGSSENLFTPVEWEVTPWEAHGRQANRLELELKVATASERLSWSSAYAFHDLGGIDRAVSLHALPPVHVRSLRVVAGLDEACRDGQLTASVAVEAPSAADVDGWILEASLAGPDGEPVALSASRVPVSRGPDGWTATLEARVPRPLPWSAETPRLYALALELKAGGATIERIERRVGFRRVEVRGSELLLNGKPIKLAGACRHETDPLTGRADTMRHAEEDVRLIRAASLNYIRTSHYPPTMELVEAADRLGVYLEVEAPFCWVAPDDDLDDLRAILTPTSAMVDLYHSHPSVIIWSLANESHFNPAFELSNELVKRLDPTRPTTFNNPDPKRICDLANLHYPPLPWDEQAAGDPRPLLLGEYWFPVCHEQTDVRVNPGLRELFGYGHADPESERARRHAESFAKPFLKPGAPPGAWTRIVRSPRVAGGAIWAAFDEPFWFADGEKAGYAWHHGFWGIIDAWRRPKPEHWLSKLIFAPVWFPARSVEYREGQAEVRIPVENRHAFTDLAELGFSWELGGRTGSVRAEAPPGATGSLAIPVPAGTREGDSLVLRVHDPKGDLVTAAAIRLGRPRPIVLPEPRAGSPAVRREGNLAIVEGEGFSLVLDVAAGDFVPGDPRHRAAVAAFPSPHVTRYDFGDLAGAHGKPYAVWPDRTTRVVEKVEVSPGSECLEISVAERYDVLAGTTSWRLDRKGIGRVAWDHAWTGPETDTREAGVRFALDPRAEELRWRRSSEWGVYPEDSIARVEGRATAFRPGTRGADPEGVRPEWPWSQDQTELGTADFRSVKYDVFEASLLAPDATGLRLHARADLHVRASVGEGAVWMHVLTRCPLGQVTVQAGDRIAGECTVELHSGPD